MRGYCRGMSAEADIPRRVAQARHDIEDIYELSAATNEAVSRLAGGQRRLAERVEDMQQTLDVHSGRLGRLEENQRAHGERLDSMGGRLDSVDGRLDTMSGQLGEVLDLLRSGRA